MNSYFTVNPRAILYTATPVIIDHTRTGSSPTRLIGAARKGATRCNATPGRGAMIVTNPMQDYDAKADKETGNRTDAANNNKPAVITIDVPGGEARTVEAQHCMRSDDGTVSIYLGSRSEGIDIQVHISRCVIDRVTHADDDVEGKPLVTDGGRDVYTAECNAYNCAAILTDRDRDRCSGCQPNDHRAHAEKSREIVENADVDVGDIVRYEDQRWLVEGFGEWHRVALVPEGIVPGRHLDDDQYAVVDIRDVERVNTDDPRDDSDPDIIADGGREIVNGDSVLHAGEQWRVARVGVSDVEIYQLGDGSEIVPINSVELVPEVEA